MAGNSRAYKRRPKGLPLSISGLQLWLDASDSATLFTDSAGTTAATADGDPIGRWADKSGNGRHATQSDGANKPTLKIVSSQYKLQTDGVNDVLNINSPGNNQTFIFVIKILSYNNAQSVFQYNYTSGIENDSYVLRFFPNIDTIYGGDSADIVLASGSETRVNGIVTLSIATQPQNKLIIRRNNNKITSKTSINLFNSSFHGRNISCEISELLVYDSYLGSSDLTFVSNYLNAKWSIY